MLIIFHQGRVGSTALSSILSKQTNTHVFGEIFSGHLYRRLIFKFLLKIFGLKPVLSFITTIKSADQEPIYEIKTHQLPFSPLRLFYEVTTLADCPNVNFLILTRSGPKRLSSIKKALELGSYHFKSKKDLDFALKKTTSKITDKCWFNGRYDLISLHEKRSEFDDQIISNILYPYLSKTLILDYDTDLRDDIKYAIFKLNECFKCGYIPYESDVVKVSHV